MRIVEVASRSDLKRFVRLPRELYAGLPGFEPSLDLERLQLFDRHAPFFRHGEAQFWIATDEAGRPLGRISAQFDRDTPAARAHIGHFGCLDAVDDADVVAALLEAARAWHAARGRTLLEGPYTLSINEEAGLQIEGQALGDMILMPWNPAYLAAHVEAAGLVGLKDLLAYLVPPHVGRDWRGLRLPKDGLVGRIQMRKLNVLALEREARLMADLFNDSWRDNWGFVPLAAEELAVLLKTSRPLLRPRHAVFFEIDGRAIAFAFCMPNALELFRGFGGRLLPFNWARLLWRFFTHRFTAYRTILLGVRGEFRATSTGARLSAAAMAQLFAANPSDVEVESSWILEDNMRMRRLLERIGYTISKRYRIYGDAAAALAPH